MQISTTIKALTRAVLPVDALLVCYYKAAGRRPWGRGYVQYKQRELSRALNDQALLQQFRLSAPLPPGYGWRLDERIVEYPWTISRLRPGHEAVLDAGSTLNFQYLLDLPTIACKSVVTFTLAPEGVHSRENVSYLYGDLRETFFKDACFDTIVCISTLEHVGMDNNLLYSTNAQFREDRREDYLIVIAELWRVLRPGGQLLLTVPYGRSGGHGWFQQFDEEMVERVIATFAPSRREKTYYKYSAEGWNVSDAEACAQCEYFDIHAATVPNGDGAAAARAVACVQLVK